MLRLTGAVLVLASGVLTRQSLLTASRARRTALRESARTQDVRIMSIWRKWWRL